MASLVPETPLPGEPARAHFRGRDDRGHRVELRRPEGDELACHGCLRRAVNEILLEDDPFAAHRAGRDTEAELEQIAAAAAAAGPDPGDFTEALWPASGQPGHDCSQSFVAPVWLVSDPACDCQSRTAPATGRGACPDGPCGAVSLEDAMAHLPRGARQVALDAHLRVLNELYAHLDAAEALLDGTGTEDALAAACLTCLADPEFHVDELEAEVVCRTLELGPVLRGYDVTMRLGDRRAGGGPR